MKQYQNLIGAIIIAVAIVVAGVLIANAIDRAGGNIGGMISSGLGVLSK